MHLDLNGTGLKKEEVLFIGMAISTAKALIGIHLSGNNIDYYERIFLRTLVNAKVAFQFRNKAEEFHKKSQKEKKEILELENHENDSKELARFVEQWMYIDKQRFEIDEQINTIIKEIDLTSILN